MWRQSDQKKMQRQNKDGEDRKRWDWGSSPVLSTSLLSQYDWPLAAGPPAFIPSPEDRHHRKAKVGKPDWFEGKILVIKIIHITSIFVPIEICLIREFKKRKKMIWREKVVIASPDWGDQVPWNDFLLWIWEKPPVSLRYLQDGDCCKAKRVRHANVIH